MQDKGANSMQHASVVTSEVVETRAPIQQQIKKVKVPN